MLLIVTCTASATNSQKVPHTQILDLSILSEGPSNLNAEETENLNQKLQDNPPKKYSIVELDLYSLYNNNWETTALVNNTQVKISFEYNKNGSSTDNIYTYEEYKIYETDYINNEKIHIGCAGISTNIENSITSLWASLQINNKTIWFNSINEPQYRKFVGLLTE